jgi:3-phenylpropionate/trans-cinnamate dioxygenase ferredoxin reductase subunit
MTSLDTVVIVGAAHAGGRAAQAIRAAGFVGRVVLIGEESWPPYERPPLSKALLVGDEGIERVQLNHPSYYEEKGIELRLGERVREIDLASRQIKTSGAAIAYDRLMLTTGARVRRLDLPGSTLPGVLYLRTIDDSEAIRDALKRQARVVVIGGGFIGLEVAASARKRGCHVTVLEATDRLMGRAVAPEVGTYFADLHRRHGTEIRLGTSLVRFEGAGRLERIVLADGSAIEADLAVIGIGIVPNVELAGEAGLAIDNGIIVDDRGRTSDPHIFAAGDVANQPNAFLGRRIRLESYQNAQDQGMAVGRNMIGGDEVHNDRLWVWTDQYDVNLQMLGAPTAWDRLVFRGDIASGSFAVFYLLEGRIVGVNTINNGREIRVLERLMASGVRISPDQLADPGTNLRKATTA